MILLCSLQDIKKHQHLCSEVYTCTIWPKENSPYKNVWEFAPTQELVGGYKNWAAKGGDERWRSYKPLSDEQYTAIYEQLLDSRIRDIEQWISEQKCGNDYDKTVALCCFCKFTAPFCHLDALENWFWKTFRRNVTVERKH